MKRAVFPGSFDPFTLGHYDIVMRGLALFDEIIIALGVNANKKTFFDGEQRKAMIEQAFEGESRVSVREYNDLTVNLAKDLGADFILRGVRTVGDFEFEHSIASANRKMTGVETVLLYTLPEHSFISSSIVRDWIRYGQDATELLPPGVKLPQ